jgi:hypothetical protein
VILLDVNEPQTRQAGDRQRRRDRDREPGAGCEDHCPFDGVPQFSDISRPRISLQRRHVFGRDFGDLLAEGLRELVDETPGQERNVVGALP